MFYHRLFRKKNIIIFSLLLVGLFATGFYFIYPFGLPNAERYFDPLEKRKLQKDEIGQFNYVYRQYQKLSFTGDEFSDWNKEEQLFWRYGIAFSAYAMPSIAMISEKHAGMAKYSLQIMIKKMKSKRIWGDWTEYGLSDDPISEGNIMYKGHLNLMYGLYQMMTGSEEFSKEYTWLTQKIVHEMRRHHKEGKHEGADCEPGRYFAQCNSISLLSLKIYDQLYGTKYSEKEVQWTIQFIKDKMTEKDNGFYLKMYNSELDFCNPAQSGYTNAWTMTFLRVFDKPYNEKLYPIWKEHFTHQIGPFAYVKEDLEAGASPLATMTGMIAAKEFGDIKLFTRLRNSVDRNIYQKSDSYHYVYKNINNAIYNGPILWTKVHVGWQNILNHDWGHKKKFKIPEVEELAWTDILDQEILVMQD